MQGTLTELIDACIAEANRMEREKQEKEQEEKQEKEQKVSAPVANTTQEPEYEELADDGESNMDSDSDSDIDPEFLDDDCRILEPDLYEVGEDGELIPIFL